MKKVLLSGCSGKMGHVIAGLIATREDCEIIAGVDLVDRQDTNFPVYESFSGFSGKADVIIDFSHPAVLPDLLAYAIRTKTPTVVATTGFEPEQVQKIKEAASEIPVFFTFNMSLGINLMLDLAQRAAKVLGNDFDIEIIEKHHNQKIDAPSGTALMIADAISEGLETAPRYEYDRHSKRIKRSKDEIGLHAVRGGSIVGEHEVLFAGHDEIISIEHRAMSKEIFAVGSVNAAVFVSDQPKGLYAMQDLIAATES